MAHKNIDQRREAVMSMISGKYTNKDILVMSLKFNCSIGAIRGDINHFSAMPGAVIYPSRALKRKISYRDEYTCQYCGVECSLGCIDHVIPPDLGGNGLEYNLVFACNSCNVKKGHNGRIWTPLNIKSLKIINHSWAEKIINLSVKNI